MSEQFKDFIKIGLDTRTANVLLSEGINTIEKLKEFGFLDLLKIPGIGLRSCKLIHRCLSEVGISINL